MMDHADDLESSTVNEYAENECMLFNNCESGVRIKFD